MVFSWLPNEIFIANFFRVSGLCIARSPIVHVRHMFHKTPDHTIFTLCASHQVNEFVAKVVEILKALHGVTVVKSPGYKVTVAVPIPPNAPGIGLHGRIKQVEHVRISTAIINVRSGVNLER